MIHKTTAASTVPIFGRISRLSCWLQKPLVILICPSVVAIVVGYCYVLPLLQAWQYHSQFQQELPKLSDALFAVSHTTETPLFTDPDANLQDLTPLLGGNNQLVIDAEDTLSVFELRSQQPSAFNWAGYIGLYNQQQMRQRQAKRIILQCREVLNKYRQLISFLQVYINGSKFIAQSFNDLSKVGNFNLLAGKDAAMLNISKTIDGWADQLQTQPTPDDFIKFKTEALITFRQVASGYKQLSNGLYVAIDSDIDGGATAIEEATQKNQIADRSLLVTVADASPTLKQVSDLYEKVNYIED